MKKKFALSLHSGTMPRRGQKHCWLLQLPIFLIEELCSHLSTKDRVRLVSTCRQLLSQLHSSAVLWGAVSVSLRRTRQVPKFTAWLARKRRLVTSVSVKTPESLFSELNQEVADHLALALRRMAGGPLRSLELHLSHTVEFDGSMLLGLASLQRFVLSVDYNRDRRVIIPKALSSLTALTQLALGPCEGVVVLQPGCLPAGLAALSLRCSPYRPPMLGPALSGVRALRELHITHAPTALEEEEDSWDYLTALTALTALTLRPYEVGKLLFLPEELGALTGLRHLDLSSNYQGWKDDDEEEEEEEEEEGLYVGALAPLTALTQLTYLSLERWLLPEYPQELEALSQLQVLDLSCNCFEEPLPRWPFLSGLQELRLDLALAARSLEQLGSATALTRLRLTRYVTDEQPECYCSEPDEAYVLRELPVLGALPRLAVLAGDEEPLSVRSFFLEQHPAVKAALAGCTRRLRARNPGLRVTFPLDTLPEPGERVVFQVVVGDYEYTSD